MENNSENLSGNRLKNFFTPELLKRCITGAVYLLCLAALLALKQLVPVWGALGFDVLFAAIAVIGSIEFVRAFGEITFPQKVFVVAYCSAVIPVYVLCELTVSQGLLAVGILSLAALVAVAVLSAVNKLGCTVKGTLYAYMGMAYCGGLSWVLSVANHTASNSVAALILLFLSVSFADSFAYIVGTLLKRWLPWKLAPQISPNKTVIGAIGGIAGGIVGAIIAYYIFESFDTFVWTAGIGGLEGFIVVGLLLSIFGQVGDLFESGIKRKCGVKDMGNLLPGHGGVLDRFDSVLFGGVVIALSFGLILI